MLKKRFRRILPLVFTVLLLLQGCTARPLTAPLMLARTRAAVNRERSVSAEVLIEAKAEVSYSGMEFSVPLKIKTSAETAFDSGTMHASGTVGSSILGVSLDLPMELYSRTGGEETVIFARIDNGQWTKASRENAPAGEGGVPVMLGAQALSGALMYDGTTLCEGKECRQIDLTLDGEAVRELLGQSAALSAVNEVVSGAPEDLELSVSLFIDDESKLPVRVCASSGKDLHLMEYTLKDAKIEIVFTAWGSPESVEIPPDVLNASDAAPPNISLIPGLDP